MKTSIIFGLLACALSLTGCFGYSSLRSPEMKGRVVDADTQTPISDARVSIHEAPSVSTKTDEDGRFDIERRHNYSVGTILHQEVSLDGYKFWSPILDVSAKGYTSVTISADKRTSTYDESNQCFIMKDISLRRESAKKEPNQPPEPTRSVGP